MLRHAGVDGRGTLLKADRAPKLPSLVSDLVVKEAEHVLAVSRCSRKVSNLLVNRAGPENEKWSN